MSVERHEIHEQSVGAYLLGALEDSELSHFDAHLEECHLCRDEVERLRPAVDALPRSVTPMPAPPRLKTALMAEVEADLVERGDAPARAGLATRLRERFAVAGGSVTGLRPAAAWVSVAILLVVGGLAGFGVTQLTSDSGAETLAATVDDRQLPQASGSLLVPHGMNNGAILRVNGMPTLKNSSTYQVWIRRDGEAVSQGLFSVGADGIGTAAVQDHLEGADAVMVTREAAGGARAPSEEPVLTVPL